MALHERTLPTVLSALLLGLSAVSAACYGPGEPSKPSTTQTTAPTEPSAPDPEAAAPSLGAVDPKVISTLKRAGLTLDTLPDDLAELADDEDKLDAVMRTFTIALGTSCDGCHSLSGERFNYRAETPNKKLTRKMWSTFVRGLARKDGEPFYCDTCHQAKTTFLARDDDAALEHWMQVTFVDALVRRDGASHDCTTCHGADFDGSFLETWRD